MDNKIQFSFKLHYAIFQFSNTRSVDELKHSVTSITKMQQQQQNQKHQRLISLCSGPFDKQLADASRIATFSRPLRPTFMQQNCQFSSSTCQNLNLSNKKTANSLQQIRQNLKVCFRDLNF